MDKQYNVKTLIKGYHKFSYNEFVVGRISGIAYMCGMKMTSFHNACDTKTGNSQFTHSCTPEQYDKFMNIIDLNYPGLCEFCYKGTKESE